MMINLSTDNPLAKSSAVGALRRHSAKGQNGFLADVGKAVRVSISEEGKLLSQKEKKIEGKTGDASKELAAMDAEEKDRQEKLEKIDELTEQLEDGTLSEKDKKMISGEIATLKEETKTKADEISEYRENLDELKKNGETGSERYLFYENEIGRLKDVLAGEAAHRAALVQQSNQEQSDAASSDIKENDKDQAKGSEKEPDMLDAILLKETAKRETSLIKDAVQDKDGQKEPAVNGAEQEKAEQLEPVINDAEQEKTGQEGSVANDAVQDKGEQKD